MPGDTYNIDLIYRRQGLNAVYARARTAKGRSAEEIAYWALGKNLHELARQACGKLNSEHKWNLLLHLCAQRTLHPLFGVILGNADPMRGRGALLFAAANNPETLRVLVRHPKTVHSGLQRQGKPLHVLERIDEAFAQWQRECLQQAVGDSAGATPKRRM